eukprot:3901399-Pyramimonas_sp.AAC.1
MRRVSRYIGLHISNRSQTRGCRSPMYSGDNVSKVTAHGGVWSAHSAVPCYTLLTHVCTVCAQVNARVLPPPHIQYGGNASIKAQLGTWNLLDVRFHAPAQLVNWGVVCCLPKNQAENPR